VNPAPPGEPFAEAHEKSATLESRFFLFGAGFVAVPRATPQSLWITLGMSCAIDVQAIDFK